MEPIVTNMPAKIEQIAAYVKKLQKKINVLEKENKQLLEKIEQMASATHTHAQDVRILTEEKERTKQTLEELIKNIDQIMAAEMQS